MAAAWAILPIALICLRFGFAQIAKREFCKSQFAMMVSSHEITKSRFKIILKAIADNFTASSFI